VLGHDLRNPLASLIAGARILDRSVASEKERQIVAMMQTTVTRMAGLIDDILDLPRGRLRRSRSSSSTKSIVAETVDARKRRKFPVDSRAKISDGPAIGI